MMPQSLKQNRVDTNVAPVFAPDWSAAILVTESSTNFHEQSI